jgi:hypothetical protein
MVSARGRTRSRRLVRAALLVGLAPACTDFEDPAVVIDMRVLGMRAEPPEIVTPYDPENPTAVDIDDIGAVEVCALVADPTESRALRFSMALCPPTSSGRCGGDLPVFAMGEGEVEDPERSAEPIRMCAEIDPSPDLLLVLSEAVSADDLAGFGGISAQVALRVTPEGGGDTLFAFKRVRYSPQLPDERTPNANPTVDGFIGLREPTGERGLDFPIPLGRCGEVEPFPVSPGERVTLLPDEAEGARERYVVPTFDGGVRSFTENLTYQWHATEGDWSPFESGGTIDVAGNEPPIDSTWTAPSDRDIVGDGIDVRMWIVQRDERGGQAWYDTCARVVP